MTGFNEQFAAARRRASDALAQARARWQAHPWSAKLRSGGGKTALRVVGGFAVVFVALIIFLGVFDWNYFKGPVERIASAQTGRTVKIDGDLRVKLLSWTPGAEINGLRVSQPKWAGTNDMAVIRRLKVNVKLLPLFTGDVILPVLQVDQPRVALFRTADGRNNWTFGNGKKREKPFSLPPIQNFEIKDGVLRIDDKVRRLVFTGQVTSSQMEGGKAVQAFRLNGDGTLNGETFDLDLTGGPLLNVDPDKPYPFDATIKAGATQASARGNIRKPFDLAVFDTTLSVSGPDMADVYYLTGLTLPNTPPYKVSGVLTRRGNVFAYNKLNGRVGDSDLAGFLSVETGRERPLLKADLSSRSLDFDDLAAVLGAAPKVGAGNTASPQQVKIANELKAERRLFPDAPLKVERLRSMDARVKFRAASVRSEAFPITRASMNLVLENGVLTMDPLMFGFPRGQLAGMVKINAQPKVPAVDLDMRLTGARLEQFLPAANKDAIEGSLIGRAKLSSSGASVRDAAGNANGQVTLVAPSGEIRAAFAELLGVNVIKGLGLLFSEDQKQAPLRCAVADFKVTNGIMRSQTLVFDTGPTLATGGGQVNLKTERMDLTIKGKPKEFRLVRLAVPISLSGPLTAPKLGVNGGQAAGQVGLAATLGSLLSPLAAILPFVDPGLEKDANCSGLVSRAGTGKPAPERVAQEPSKRSASRSG